MIPENWTAIEAAEKAVRKQTGDPNAGFNANLFFLGDGRQLSIPIFYRKKTKDGWTKKHFEVMVGAKFCPLTGKPLYEDLDDSKN